MSKATYPNLFRVVKLVVSGLSDTMKQHVCGDHNHMKLSQHKLTKEKVLHICELALTHEGLTIDIDNSTIVSHGKDWTLEVPLYIPKRSRNSGPDFKFVIHSDGYMAYQNWSGCKFKYFNALNCYQILLQAVE